MTKTTLCDWKHFLTVAYICPHNTLLKQVLMRHRLRVNWPETLDSA